MTTECCWSPISSNSRYCPKCGWEARIMEKLMTGTIKTLNDKGYGFILSEGKEYFFHRSACVNFDDLDRGMKVEFSVAESPKGPRAESVRLV